MTVIETNPNSTDVREATILARYTGIFTMRLAELQAKAEKFGVEPVAAKEISRQSMKVTLESGIEIDVPTVTFEISGMTPALPGGWKFVGSIEHAANGINLVHGNDARLLALRDVPSFCDHCKTKRLRSKTIIVESETGEIVRVGSSCMKDFLGYHGSPERYLGYFDQLLRDLDDLGRSDRKQIVHNLLTYVTATSATMRFYGAFIPKSEDNSTAYVTRFVLDGNCGGANSEKQVAAEIRTSICDADRERAAAAIEWAKNLDADLGNSYLGNLREICSDDVLLGQHVGIAASLISAYERQCVKDALKAVQDAEVKGSVITGRYVIEGTVLLTKWQESDFGGSLKMLVQVEQADGIVRLWGSVPSSIDPEVGDKVRFTAAVETGRDADFGFFKRPTKAEVVSDDVDVDVDATEEIFGFVKGVLDASTPDLDDDVVREPVVVELRTRRGHFPRCTLRLPVGHGLAAHDRVRMVVRSAARENATAADVLTIEKA